MTDLIFSKQIRERQKHFPWLKNFQQKLLKDFQNDLDFDALQFLLQNVEEEVTSLPKSGKTKRREALFETIYDLFLHFWWRIQWKGRKKWSRRWKNVSSDILCATDESSKCCEKLLYYIIFLAITLSQGSSHSEWVGKVLQVIHILPSFDSMIYNSLLQINKLYKNYRLTYIAILKHVLCTEVVVSVTEPAVYIKIMILMRRLRKFTNKEFTLSALESTALRYKPPSDIIQWMSSHAIDFPLEKHESFGKKLLSKKSEDLFHKLSHVVTTPDDSEKKIRSHLCQSGGIEILKNKNKVKKCKRKRKSHSKLKLRDSQLNLSVDGIAVSLNLPVHSEVSASLNCKMQAHTTITKKYKKIKKNLLDKRTRMIEEAVSNEFLNSSFAKAVNTSKITQENLQHVPERNNGVESNTLDKCTFPNESIVITDVSSNYNDELKQAKPCNGPSSLKKIKLDSDETLSFPLKTSEILTNACTNKCTGVSNQYDSFAQSPVPFYRSSSNSSLFDTKTSENQKSSNQTQTKQTLPDKIQFKQIGFTRYSESLDNQKIHPSALLKHQPNVDSTSRHCDMSKNALYESIVTNQIHTNADSPSKAIPASSSSSLLRAPCRLKVLCDVPPNIFHGNNISTQSDTDKAIASNNSIGGMYLSKNVNENIRINDEINYKHPNFGNSSADLSNSVNHCASWKENQSNSSSFLKGLFDDHRWGESQPLIPTVNRSLEPTQNYLVNQTKSSINSEVVYVNSSATPRIENRLGNVTVSQNNTSPNCVVDCKIVSDYEPNAMHQESITSFKVVINVSCKAPEDAPNQQSEHIFGNFNNASENYFDSSQNLFSTANLAPEMPKLTPFYDNPPILTAAVNVIATPPDSELEISIPNSSSKQSEAESLTTTCFEVPQNKPNYSSTPQDAHKLFHKRISNEDSDFKTPQTSDCESSSECNVENVNLTKSPVTRSSIVKSSVDDILERLNYRKHLPKDKSESYKATTDQNSSKENVSYRSFTGIYSCDELSEDSTVSTVSRLSKTDDELNKNTKGQKPSILKDVTDEFLTDESNLKTSDISKQRPLNVLKKGKKKGHSKKYSEGDPNIPETTSCNITHGYNLRPRKKLNKPSNLEDFF